MKKAKLYLFIGYPGAGKTTVSKILADKTKARHIWADVERHKLFPEPTHSKQESDELYEKLNAAADHLLSQNKSVIYDTNFNYYSDRAKVKKIADKYNLETIVIWITTPKKTAYSRSVLAHKSRNLYHINMDKRQFELIASKLEKPQTNEKVIEIDGTKVKKAEVLKILDKYI